MSFVSDAILLAWPARSSPQIVPHAVLPICIIFHVWPNVRLDTTQPMLSVWSALQIFLVAANLSHSRRPPEHKIIKVSSTWDLVRRSTFKVILMTCWLWIWNSIEDCNLLLVWSIMDYHTLLLLWLMEPSELCFHLKSAWPILHLLSPSMIPTESPPAQALL